MDSGRRVGAKGADVTDITDLADVTDKESALKVPATRLALAPADKCGCVLACYEC